MKDRFYALLALLLLTFQGTYTFAQNPAWKGRLIYTYGEEIKTFDLASKADRSVLKTAREAHVGDSGEFWFIDMRFPTKGRMLRKSNSTFTQYKNVLDLTASNPLFKERLDNYSVIRGTGNSDVLSSIAYPRVSPDGKYAALTIFGYDKQIYDKDCVVIFDIASSQEVARFEGKYGASWTKDNGLIMAGSYKSASVNGQEYHSKNPGIFLCAPDLKTLRRIDPELDDPAPYHPALSPDGQKLAFILNNHVWTINIDGGNMKQITEVDNDNIESFPVWSPDGKWLACWSYKTFERSFFTAIAIVPSNPAAPVVLSDKANVWPRDVKNYRISGGAMQISWK